MKKRFQVLQIIATIFKVIGIVVGALALLGALIAFVASLAGGSIWQTMGVDSSFGFFTGFLSALMILVFGALYALIIYGYGELITLLIAMEENTHNTVLLLEKGGKD
jgi:hypothetical protein